jgi:hypothetical protein
MKKYILSLLVTVGLIGSASAATLTDGLSIYYGFNGNTVDLSGNGNDGILQGASYGTDRYGNINGALKVTLTTGVVSQSNIGITGNSDRTVSVWVNPDSGLVWPEGYILVWGIDTPGSITSVVYAPYQSKIGFFGFNYDVEVDQDPSTFTGGWHNITTSYTSSLLNTKIYVDGILKINQFLNNPNDSLNTGDSPLYVNYTQSPLDGNNAFSGLIDDVRIYNRVLSSADVQILAAPEPSTYALFGIGAIGMLMVLRRKKTA